MQKVSNLPYNLPITNMQIRSTPEVKHEHIDNEMAEVEREFRSRLERAREFVS